MDSWGKGRQSALHFLFFLLLLFVLGARGETGRPDQAASRPVSLGLPAACVEAGKKSRDASSVLEALAKHPSADAYNALGALFAQSEHLPCAIASFKRALQLQPASWQTHYNLGLALLSHQDDKQAAEEFRVVTKQKPDFFAAHNALGLALQNLGDLDGAAQQFEEARKLNPDSVEAASNLARTYPEQKNYPAEIYYKKSELGRGAAEAEASQKARRLGDSDGDAAILGAKGNQLLMAGDARGAAAAYRDALKLAANDPKMHYNLSLALEKLGDQAEEKKELQMAVKLDPNLAEAHNQLGILALTGGNNADAEREFRAALSINPAYAEAENNLGSVYVQQGKNGEAISLFQKATADDPKYARGFLNWGLVLAAQGDYAGAIGQFQKAIGISPDFADVYRALGMAQGKAGQGREAVQTFRKLVALQPTSSEAHVNLGIALADQYDLQGALGEFSEATRLHPENAFAHYNKARLLYDMGKRADARVEAETAYHVAANYPPLLYLLGLVEREANNLPLSTEAFQKLVTLEPHNAVARFLLGQNLQHLGKQEEAIEQWKAAVQDDPNNVEATYNLAKALGSAKKPEADVYMARFQELQKQRQLSDRVQTLNNFALQAANERNWPQAVGQLKEAIEACASHCPQLPVLHKNLGLIYARTGDVDQAEEELRTALKLKPDEPDAVKALGILEGLRDKRTPSN